LNDNQEDQYQPDDSPYRDHNGTLPSDDEPFGNSGMVPYPGDERFSEHEHHSRDHYISSSISRESDYRRDFVNSEHDDNFCGHSMSHDDDFSSYNMSLDVEFSDGPPHPPPDVPFNDYDMPSDAPLMGPSANRLHCSRLGARDHPAWLSSQVRDKLQQHHLNRLHSTIGRLKEAIMMTSNPSPPRLLPRPHVD
jgi:hypothetical protein